MKHHDLPFEIWEIVKFPDDDIYYKYAREVMVIGLDVWGENGNTIKVKYFISGSGLLTDWVKPERLLKLSAVEQLGDLA